MHYYERNIADIKAEYTEFLIYILSPLIFEGMRSLYDKAIEQEEKYIQMSKDNVNVKNPGVFKIFQHFLKNIQTLNQNLIEAELIRIRDASKHADIFEKLIKAVIKSNIILLTYNASGKQCKIVNEKLHEKVDCKIFIHKVYIESAKQFYNAPELFWHKLPPLEIKRNQRECINMINKSINVAIKESMPMNDILTEYLKNDYIVETEENRINRIKDMINNNVEDKINYFDEEDQKVLLSEKEQKILITDEENNLNANIRNNINDIEDLIQNDNLNDQNDNINDQNNDKIENKQSDMNEDEFMNKINNINKNTFQSKNKRNNQLNINQNIKEEKIQNIQPPIEKPVEESIKEPLQKQQVNEQLSDDNNINIVKNKLDDRTYLNAFYN